MLLLLAAKICETEADMINALYVAWLMTGDWGSYSTSTSNLKKIKEALVGVPVLTDQHQARIKENVEKL